ncbi:glutamate-cysteine ligase regulatory subunit [Ophiocordyceps camponoti-floridani]|uniref:GCS light chain n=1 Tax=Ophiocordyceps camponoti-floridani TaxID=2030778 RepID=A0A8H4QCT6_9HYPO|nr:glutamate-cysteine ligase regulatory subunit [Ophiocordyceps camponoti-floridani]
MAKLVLSTGNVMSAGRSSIIRRPGSTTKSNVEFISALRGHLAAARLDCGLEPPLVTNGAALASVPASAPWMEREGKVWYVPRIAWGQSGLRDEVSQYEITVKLFLLSGTPVAEREQYAREALALVSKELAVDTIDLLVVSFPGMSFQGNCEWEADKINGQQGNLEDQIKTWAVFEELHRQGVARRLGVAEFGSERLAEFIRRTTIRPVVDQINLRDCCNVPPPLKKLAEQEGIELNVHTDCTDILSHGTLRELLGHGPHGAGVLEDAANNGAGLRGDISPQWVARYVAFVRDRGVVENKGYFAGAKLVGA